MAIFFSHLSYNHFAGCCPKTRASNARRQLLSGHVMPLGQGLNSLDFIQTSETISTNGGKKKKKQKEGTNWGKYNVSCRTAALTSSGEQKSESNTTLFEFKINAWSTVCGQRAKVIGGTTPMILLMIALRLNLLCCAFPDLIIDSSCFQLPQRPSAILSSQTDSSHASLWPLQAVIVSLFPSWQSSSVTSTWPYVTLWRPSRSEVASINSPK